jgi:hypothetical protein
MSNIVGEGFPKEIIKQIDTRQKVYGSAKRTNEELSYLEARTGWVKLVSSVDLVSSTSIRGISGNAGSNLAQENVLFNGTTNESPTSGALETYQKSGIWPGGNANQNNYAYGMGGTDYGLRPMPGIQSATIKTETRGSIKTAEVKIQANNRQQFDIIDLLYMRLGFSMLLEWGNSSYFDNSDVYIKDNPHSLADEFLLGKLQYDTIYKKIQDKRLASCGNYDALIGKVVNFSWNFTKDLTYEITLKIISMGDVIESLKTNILLPGDKIDITSPNNTTSNTSDNPPTTPPEPTPEDTIKAYANVHQIGKMFYKNSQRVSTRPTYGTGIQYLYTEDSELSGYDTNRQSVAIIKQTYKDEGGSQYYIKLGWFLGWIQKNLINNIDTGDANLTQQVKQLKINNKVKENIIYVLGRQISTNPGICLFNVKFKFDDSNFSQFLSQGDTFYTPSVNGNRYGYIMNSYFNMSWILTQMESLKNSEGRISLYDLLECLCKGWNEATGNFSKLSTVIDTEENEIKFVDEVILPDGNNFITNLSGSTELAYFNVQGYYFDTSGSSTGGFIRDLNFTTTVPPNLSTMITVGSTSNGYVVGQDATALSRMNAGLKDRFKPNISTPETKPNEIPSSSSLESNYQTEIKSFNTFLKELGSSNGITFPKWNPEAITAFSNAASTFYEYDQASQTQAAQEEKDASGSLINSNAASPNGGFLPFDLSITMDGLSGMKVYQKYTIDTTYLPSNYPTSLEFIIKSINNTISNNQWTTTLESMAIPKNPFGSTIGQSAISQASRNENRGTKPTFTGNTPNADKLRALLISLGYTEKGKELSNGGDISPELLRYASSVFKVIKKQLPNLNITVTGGNDRYHQKLSYKSSHSLGTGLDIAISPATSANKKSVDTILGGFAAGNQNLIVSFINEYDYPSSAATGGHFHLRIGGKIESERISEFNKLASQGQLITYPIV